MPVAPIEATVAVVVAAQPPGWLSVAPSRPDAVMRNLQQPNSELLAWILGLSVLVGPVCFEIFAG